MGCDPKSGWNCVAEEEPAQLVKVEGCSLDRFEVTADEYQTCVDAGVCFIEVRFWTSATNLQK